MKTLKKKSVNRSEAVDQARLLANSGFARLLAALARFPFATTSELVELVGGLSLHRVQLYLRRATGWGWLEYCDHYLASGPELSPLAATGGPEALLRLPGIPLPAEEAEKLLAAQEVATPLPQPAARRRLYRLTRRGALALAYLGQATLPDGLDYRELAAWRNTFAGVTGASPGENFLGLKGAGSLAMVRHLLLALYRPTGGFNWEENISLVTGDREGAEYEVSLAAVALFKPPDGQGKTRVILLVADTENLPVSWIRLYLRELASIMEKPGLALSGTPRPLGKPPGGQKVTLPGQGQPPDFWPVAAARLGLAGLLPAEVKGKDPLLLTPEQFELLPLVLTRSRARPTHWQVAVGYQKNWYCQSPVILTLDEIEEEGAGGLLSRMGLTGYSQPAFRTPVTCPVKPAENSFISGLGSYLDQDRAFAKKPEAVAGGYLGGPGKAGKRRSQLLARPTWRRLLYTLHAFGPLDYLALYRLTGVKITGLAGELNWLEKSGLVTRYWGETATASRLAAPPGESPVAVETPERHHQRFGLAGAVAAALAGQAEFVPFPYSSEKIRLKRYYYYLTGAGLEALAWLEGFPFYRDPGYLRRREGASPAGNFEQGKNVTGSGRGEVEPADTPPGALVEHSSAVANFFLSLPSRHFFSPFSTTPGWYAGTARAERLKENLPATAPGIWLEGWQAEPFCHRFYRPPEELVFATRQRPVTGAVYAGGQLLPDGYGELRLASAGGTPGRLGFYLEYERGLRNWLPRYLAKAAGYLRQRWSGWLLDCFAGGEIAAPPRKLAVLLVAPDREKEREMAGLFAAAWLGTAGRLWWECSYGNLGPGSLPAPDNPGAFSRELARQLLRLVEWFCPVERQLGERYFLAQELIRWAGQSFDLYGQARWKKFGGEAAGKLLMEAVVNGEKLNERNRPVVWPRVGLELFSTNETLLEEAGPSGPVWQKVISPGTQDNRTGGLVRGRLTVV